MYNQLSFNKNKLSLIKLNNLIFFIILTSSILSCNTFKTYSDFNGKIKSDNIKSVSLLTENIVINNPDTLILLINEFNKSKFKGMYKGASWKTINIEYSDTILTLKTNGEIIGNSNSGKFYKISRKAKSMLK